MWMRAKSPIWSFQEPFIVCAAVVADIGPSNAKLGEMSIALAEKLGGKNVNPTPRFILSS